MSQPPSLAERTTIVGLEERRERVRADRLGYDEPYEEPDSDDVVYVRDGALGSGGATRFHKRPGCYNARKPVDRTTAMEAGAKPCGYCYTAEADDE